MSIDTAPAAASHVVPRTAAGTAPDGVPDTVPDGVPETASDGEPGAQADAGPSPTGGWLVEQRGSFLVGRCDACGHTTAARRARFSMESDMLRHDAECGEPQGTADTSGA